jgi:hypothetical protein
MEEDNVSVSTHAGVNASMVSNYKTDLDPSLFAANKMYLFHQNLTQTL